MISRHKILLSPAEARALASGLAGRAPAGSRATFERAFAAHLGVERVFAVENARTALALILKGLGLRAGDRVVLPAYTFFTLPLVVEALGLRAVFAPVDPATSAIDPEGLARHLEGAAALVLIHPFGQMADVEAISAACAAAGVALIEDASQSTGAATSPGGRRAGAFGKAACFSLVAGKNLQTFGGGVISTSDPSLAQRIEPLLEPAREPDPAATRAKLAAGLRDVALTTRPGFALAAYPMLRALAELSPARLAALAAEPRRPFDAGRAPVRLSGPQAAFGVAALPELDARNARRRDNALRLLAALERTPGLQLPSFSPAALNTFNAVAVRVTGDPARLARGLLRRGIDTRPDYMEWIGAPAPPGGVLYLPNHPGMRTADVDRAAAEVRRALGR